MKFIARWIVTALAVAAAVWIVPGIDILITTQAWVGVALTALTLSLLNATVKPILKILSLPITVLTLGVFYLILNTLMLYLASWIANGLFDAGFYIQGFGSAFLASIIISIVSSILSGIAGTEK